MLAHAPSATLAQHQTALVQRLVFAGLRSTQETQNICITFVQCVEDVGPALYKCYTNVLCLLGIAAGLAAITSRHRPNVC